MWRRTCPITPRRHHPQVLERSTDSHTYIYSQYILRIPFSSSIFHPLPQPQHASQLLQVGYARGRPASGFANHALT